LYVLNWDAVKTRVDGTALTDLTAYVAQTGPSVAGPWGSASTVAATVTTTSFVLVSTVSQCFQVVAVSAGSGSSEPAVLCVPPPVTGLPSAPTNVKAN
jgi:hypothetical protein